MKVNESIARDILRLFIWFPFRWITSSVPVRQAFYLFKILGDIHFYAGRGKKKSLSEKLTRILGANGRSVRQTVKKSFENHYLDRLHISLYPRFTQKKDIEKYVVFENREIFEAEVKKNKGVLVVQPHFGPVQITLLSLALLDYKPLQIGYPTDKGLSRIGRSVAYKYRLKYEAMLPAPIIKADGYLGQIYKYQDANLVCVKDLPAKTEPNKPQ